MKKIMEEKQIIGEQKMIFTLKENTKHLTRNVIFNY